MKVLHLCSYYGSSKVYNNSFEQLTILGVEQTIFVMNKHGRKEIDGNIIYSPCIKPWMKVSLFLKTLMSLISIIRVIGLSELRKYDLIHCHTLFSDGFLGLVLSFLVKVPFVVTIRNTDFNSYMRFFYHLRFLGRYICSQSKLIIFVSDSYYEKFSHKYSWIKKMHSTVSYNGVDNFWLENINKEENVDENFNLLTIGYFDNNKNLGNAYLATKMLWFEDKRYHLTVVGGSRSDFEQIYNIKPDPRFTTFKGIVSNKELLKELYSRAGVFVLPSFRETFGLVYLEALSQNCNVICSKGEGISGVFSESEPSIEFCNPRAPKDIARAIRKFNCSTYTYGCFSDIVNDFCWVKISENMLKLYNVAAK